MPADQAGPLRYDAANQELISDRAGLAFRSATASRSCWSTRPARRERPGMTERFDIQFRPTEIRYSKADKALTVVWDDGRTFVYPAEFLRVESPSAEVQGHGPGQHVIVPGRMHVGIMAIEPVATTPCASASTTCTIPGSIPGSTCARSARSRANAGRLPTRAGKAGPQPRSLGIGGHRPGAETPLTRFSSR